MAPKSEKWPGEAELLGVFQALETAGLEGTSTSHAVKAVVKACLKHAHEFKMVVFEIQRYVLRGCEEGRIGCLGVIDAICRKETSGKVKENFVNRLQDKAKGKPLEKILASIEKDISESNRLIMAKMVHQWRKRNTFSSKVLPLFEDLKDSVEASSNKTGAVMKKDNATVGSTGGATSSGKVTSVKSKAPVKISMKLRRFCAFREGSCPFNDKCRFSHIEPGVSGRYMITRGGSKKEPGTGDDARDAMRYTAVELNDLPSSKEVINAGMTISSAAFPFTEEREKEEGFKRHSLPYSFAVQEHVALSWISEKSIASL